MFQEEKIGLKTIQRAPNDVRKILQLKMRIKIHVNRTTEKAHTKIGKLINVRGI